MKGVTNRTVNWVRPCGCGGGGTNGVCTDTCVGTEKLYACVLHCVCTHVHNLTLN
jgi:hypothetical protein